MWRGASLWILTASMLMLASGCDFSDKRRFAVATGTTGGDVERSTPETPPAPQAQPPLPDKKPGEDAASQAAALDPRNLVGLNFRETEAMLGRPTGQTEKPPAKIWTYSGDACLLNIFFYADINTREFRALTYEIKAETADGEAEEQCLAHLTPGT